MRLTKLRSSRESIRKSDKIEKFIRDFSGYIFSKIRTFNYQNYGIDHDDLLQEINIRIWKAYKSDKNIKYFRSYIKKIVNSVVVDQIRESRREIETLKRQGQATPPTQLSRRPWSETHNSNLKDIILRSLDELKESRRKVLSLLLLDYTLEEIGELLKWSKGKTYNLYYRGLNDLKKKLKEEGVFYED